MTESIIKITPLQGTSQGSETFKVDFANGAEKVFKTWDYASIYSYPKLYSRLYCDLLDYKAYEELSCLLLKYAAKTHKELNVLDLACGSGLMGKALKENSNVDIKSLVGVDILPEAIDALNRDYPEIYDDTFIVKNVIKNKNLTKYDFNCITISGGANHIELEDLKSYVNLLNENAYIVFNLLTDKDDYRRSRILGWLEQEMSLCESKIYNHRRLMSGDIVKHEAFLYYKRD
ncbi:methyltransferase domain-containing protein [Microscilla marina]|uniref:Methyltransferase domain-containing protein n=1 Tax=Microscilla marina ATCC 23134 TaxID=313606 RepID=A1ZG47_MICM2|nr:class I SAM-dependent methyltransferase [Microscilla marina]EAY30464.1 conserved hypothetical protein [Microscilla marina ATCC 23134]